MDARTHTRGLVDLALQAAKENNKVHACKYLLDALQAASARVVLPRSALWDCIGCIRDAIVECVEDSGLLVAKIQAVKDCPWLQ